MSKKIRTELDDPEYLKTLCRLFKRQEQMFGIEYDIHSGDDIVLEKGNVFRTEKWMTVQFPVRYNQAYIDHINIKSKKTLYNIKYDEKAYDGKMLSADIAMLLMDISMDFPDMGLYIDAFDAERKTYRKVIAGIPITAKRTISRQGYPLVVTISCIACSLEHGVYRNKILSNQLQEWGILPKDKTGCIIGCLNS